MNQNGTELGLTIRMMREKKGMTRPELAEAAGISESHLKKVETGSRRPGIDTYQKIIRILGEDVIAGGGEDTVKGNCVSDGELREKQTANYFSDIYPIDCAVLSANAQSCPKCCTLLSVLLSA